MTSIVYRTPLSDHCFVTCEYNVNKQVNKYKYKKSIQWKLNEMILEDKIAIERIINKCMSNPKTC